MSVGLIITNKNSDHVLNKTKLDNNNIVNTNSFFTPCLSINNIIYRLKRNNIIIYKLKIINKKDTLEHNGRKYINSNSNEISDVQLILSFYPIQTTINHKVLTNDLYNLFNVNIENPYYILFIPNK